MAFDRQLIRICASVALVAALFHAQRSLAEETPSSPEPSSVSLPSRLAVNDLVELAASQAGVSLQYDRGVLQGEVSLALSDSLTAEELWELMVAVLEARNFVIVPFEPEGVYRIEQIANATRAAPLAFTDQGLEASRDRSTVQTLVLQPEHRTAAELIASLRSVPTDPGLQVSEIAGSDLLVLLGTNSAVERLLGLIDLLDVPRQSRFFEILRIEHRTVAEMIRLLDLAFTTKPIQPGGSREDWVFQEVGSNELVVIGPADQQESLRVLIQQIDVAPPKRQRSYSVGGVPAQELGDSSNALFGVSGRRGQASLTASSSGPTVRVESLTGTVLVTATETQHAEIDALLERIAANPGGGQQVMGSFTVRNRDAGEISDLLERILSSGVSIAAGGDDQESATGLVFRDQEDRPTITVDDATNRLLVFARPAEINRIGELIDELDRRGPQVMLQATLVSLSEGDSLDLSNDLALRFSSGETQVDLGAIFNSELDVDDGVESLGSGLVGLVLNPGDFAVLSRALQTKSEGRSVSTPKILVNDGSTGTLDSVERQPFTSINASDTVATTSFGGTEDAGTNITVTPQIAEGDHLILNYTITLSDFVGDPISTGDGGIIPPASLSNTISGDVTVPDGFTIILGGIESQSDTESRSGIPLISQIPLIGWLVGNQSDSNSTSTFYVFLTATILRDPMFEDLKYASQIDMDRAGLQGDAPNLSPLWIR